MRVQGTSSTIGGAPRAARRSNDGAGFKVGRTGAGSLGAAPIGSVGSIDALLALQSIDGPDEVEAQLIDRGHDLLDRLKSLQSELLAGQLDRATLEDLQRQLGRRAERSSDPALQAVLDDIELRAAVELAKLDQPTTAPPQPDPRARLLHAYRPVTNEG